MADAIRTERLTKKIGWFSPRLLLDSLDLTVGEGHIFGLLGPNGAGKTTTFKLLLGLTRISSGAAHLFGREVPLPASRTCVGYLPETVHHPDYLTIDEYLVYHGRLAGVSDLSARIPSTLARVGLKEAGNRTLGVLSKGLKQRVDIARVLMLDARLILLDEPVTGLDPMGQAALKEILIGLRHDGISLLISSHAIGILADVCDEIGILSNGRLVKSGCLETLLATDRYCIILDANGTASPGTRLPDGRRMIEVTGRAQFDAALRDFTQRNAGVIEAGPVRLSLEELFTNTIGSSLSDTSADSSGSSGSSGSLAKYVPSVESGGAVKESSPEAPRP
ncbi:MAG: ABC transporter ATP-binding protein [Candidatus Ozemobacteraceae bacterium]